MLIIIDGYNLIFTVPGLGAGTKSIDNVCLRRIRDNLISLLGRYKSIKGYEVKVVFDGATYDSSHSLMHKRIVSGIEVVFSGASSDADTVVKKLASQRRDPGNICVVTSDREIKDFVKRFGNTVIEPNRFYREVLDTVNIEKDTDGEPQCKFEGASQNEIDYWLSIFMDKQEDDKEDNQR